MKQVNMRLKKMHVKIKKELVNLSLEEDINPKKLTGEYVEPKDFYKKDARGKHDCHRCQK